MTVVSLIIGGFTTILRNLKKETRGAAKEKLSSSKTQHWPDRLENYEEYARKFAVSQITIKTFCFYW